MSNPKALTVEKHTPEYPLPWRTVEIDAAESEIGVRNGFAYDDGVPHTDLYATVVPLQVERSEPGLLMGRANFSEPENWNVACLVDVSPRNRDYIVRACNSYPALLEALKPFAEFARQFEARPVGALKMGAPLPDSHSIYGIHSGTEWAAELTLGSLRNALRIVAQAEGTQP